MLSFLKMSFLGLSLGAGLLSVGCQSDAQKMAPASHEMSDNAVRCDKCEVTWVKVPGTQSGRPGGAVIGYTSRKQDACPDCKDAASNFFATGKMEHACKACGGNMAICEKSH